ncbi:hypothetical protein Lal_00013166 [Lupinus albus]|nr:hypothetical protein Lal_00013166 [Lupinus albus]
MARQTAEGVWQRVRPAGDARTRAPVRHRRKRRTEGRRFLCHCRAAAARHRGGEGIGSRSRPSGGRCHARFAEAAINALRKGRTADNASAENSYDALKKYARDLTEAGAQREARPGHRPGRGDPAHHSDRHRGRSGPAYRQRRRARIPQGQEPPRPRYGRADRGREVSRRVRGAAEGRALRGHGGRGRNHPFIDEMHTLVGAGKADGAMDASNLLKPALARGELHCVGATTSMSTASMSRRTRRWPSLPAGLRSEPTVEDTVSILRGLKEKYEQHHGVRIQDSALVAAATLSNATSPTASCRTRPSTSWTRRLAAAHAGRLEAGGVGLHRPRDRAPENRGRGPEEGDRFRLPRPPRAAGEGTRRP